jgi:hypothetical protein
MRPLLTLAMAAGLFFEPWGALAQNAAAAGGQTRDTSPAIAPCGSSTPAVLYEKELRPAADRSLNRSAAVVERCAKGIATDDPALAAPLQFLQSVAHSLQFLSVRLQV